MRELYCVAMPLRDEPSGLLPAYELRAVSVVVRDLRKVRTRSAVRALAAAAIGVMLPISGWFSALETEVSLLPLMVPRDELGIDIGANVGLFARKLLGLTNRCIAFEPNPRLVPALRRAVGGRLRVEPVALSDASGIADLRVGQYFGEEVSEVGTIAAEN
jgi:hypothetical protein